MTLAGANAFTGGENLNGGTLLLEAPRALSATTGTVSFTGGTLAFSNDYTTDISSHFVTTAGQQYAFNTNGARP